MPNSTNPNRPIPSNTLHVRHRHRLLLRHPHLPRRQLWLNPALPSRQRSIHILYLPVPTCRSRHLLRLLHIHRNLKHWNCPPICRHSNSIHRLRPPMRTNIFLRGDSHHQPPLSYPLHRNKPCRVSLRRILRRQSHPHPILRSPLSPPIYHYGPSHSSPTLPT